MKTSQSLFIFITKHHGWYVKIFFQHVLEPSGCFDWIYFVLFETCFRSCFIYYGEQHEFSQFSEGSKLIGMFSISIDFFLFQRAQSRETENHLWLNWNYSPLITDKGSSVGLIWKLSKWYKKISEYVNKRRLKYFFCNIILQQWKQILFHVSTHWNYVFVHVSDWIW